MPRKRESGDVADDVRMRGFARRSTVDEVLGWVDRHTKPLAAEEAPLLAAAGRVLAEEVISPVAVPGFARSMMDGYAVVAADTQGASPYNPLPIRLVGESFPGRAFQGTVSSGSAVTVMTGAPLPEGANAVLPAELAEQQGQRIVATGEVPPEKHVGQRGEDIEEGRELFRAGRRLRPQDTGVLSSVGIDRVRVVRRPSVHIVITGDEVLPAGRRPHGHHITDANGPMLFALAARDSGQPYISGPLADDPQTLLESLTGTADVVLVSGGSSVGQEDHAPCVLAEHGELAVHGVAMRPSSPTGAGRLDGRLVFLLPGNPVSCLCAYDFFAGRAIRRLAGRGSKWPYLRITAPLARKISSVVGRLDYARVRIVDGRVVPMAITGASVLTSTTRADGFCVIPTDSEGFAADTMVEVFLYDMP